MKTHLININYTACFINHIACFALLLTVMAVTRGTAFAQWDGVTYTTDQTINMTGNVTMTGVMAINGCTVTINPNGASRTIYRGSSFTPDYASRTCLFAIENGGVLRIEGTSSQTITIDGNNNAANWCAVYLNNGAEAYFDYVTLQNHKKETGSFQGAVFIIQGNSKVTLNKCYAYDNTSDRGGGVAYIHTSTLNCTDCEFKRNTASATNSGGVFYCFNVTSEVNCTRCVFDGNSAGYGGALRDGTITLQDCTFTGNTADKSGGAIYVAGNLTLIDCSITGNTATGTGNGGGIYFSRTSTTDRNLYLSGKVVIKDNSSASTFGPNLYLYTNQTSFVVDINPSGLSPLSCGSSIGVTVYYLNASYPFVSPLQFANGTASNCKSAYSNHYFFCDGVRFRTGTSGSYTYPLEAGDVYYSNQSPYSGSELYVVPAGTANSWYNYADAAGCTVSGGYVTHVNTAAGLAYLAKDIASGKNYSGKTVLLTADLNMAGHNWEPIGSQCSERAFCGTFNGQGHIITGLSTTLLFDNVGLFGTVGSGGTVKNVVVASSTISASSAVNLGGIAGEVDGGSVYNCISSVTLSGGSGTNVGALVGKLTSGSLRNSFAISNDAACGSGTVTNCYVRKVSGGSASNMGTATNVGASGNTTGTFTETVTPYLYKHADNKVGTTALLTLLNAWVDAQSTPNDYARWTRTMASPINGDYPLLIMPGMKCVGTKSSSANTLNYNSSLNTMLGTHNASGDNIFFWGEETGVNTGNGSANVYFAEDASLVHTSTITNAHVGVTLDPTNGSEGVHWHMFSPALSKAPLGLSYPDNGSYTPAYGTLPTAMQPTFTGTGYFPATDFGGNDYYADWDFYCYYEPQYHWINLKRNSDNHWHEDSNNENIAYTNQSTLVRGKGYLVATNNECILECAGTLNQGSFTIPVTTQGAYRTGYNLLGNPYQSQFDFDKFADVNKALWGGTKTNASYIILNKDGYTYYAYSGSSNAITSTANRYLHPHQGFMIVATNAGTASFTNDMRVTGQTTTFRGNDHVDYPLINLIVTEDDGNRDIATIELGRPEAGGAIKQYDLHLGTGCIYSHYEDQDYAIAFTLPGISEVPVRFETDEDATYTLTWDMENGEFHYLHLIDNLTGIDIDCLTTTEYRFTAKASDYKSRFKLVFGYTGIEDDASASSETFAFIMGNELVVNGEGYFQMFDLAGRLVMTETMSGTQTTAVLPDVPTGVYVIRLTNMKGTRVQKMVIEN